MDQRYTSRATSFEQDLLWSVLDQDAVPHILAMAHGHWGLNSEAAWAAVQQQAARGRLRAYRDDGSFTPVDPALLSLDEVAQDYQLFVEPTDATHARLKEIGGIAEDDRKAEISCCLAVTCGVAMTATPDRTAKGRRNPPGYGQNSRRRQNPRSPLLVRPWRR